MTVNALNAANAYNNQLKLMQEQPDATSSNATDQSPFAQMVEHALGDAVNAQSSSETLQLQSLTGGKVELSNLVTAVANADLSLSTIVAVRDRVINAYNDIIKMSI